ncbi:MAG: NAD(P)/FAD-dependent oxidoreductase [Paracoccus sp. (in: a-proteobacteria)]|nr:NAD(P)/FAD-dependent oxidoreductase [Paracoccus sp. (in: a-proteobacteria)]
MTWDLVIVGAGPAGMGAAIEARIAGLSVLVLDEQSAPGGQIYRQVERISADEPARIAVLGPDYAHGAELVGAFRESGADYRPNALVWQIEPGKVWYLKDNIAVGAKAGRILMATGALERPMTRPGWTLPGVMSAGGAQILLKSSGLIPATDTVLMGSGPLLYLVAGQILKAGGRVQAIVETVPSARYLAAVPQLPTAIGTGYLSKGLRMLLELRRAGLRIYRGACDLEVLGTGKAEAARFSHKGRKITLNTDIVILHEGVIPNQQITRLTNCAHRWNSAQFCFEPETDGFGNASVEGLMIAGDGAGIGGALAAEAGGRLAGLEAARALGKLATEVRDERARPLQSRHRALTRGRGFLETLYAPSAPVPQDDDTIVCRCEEITAGQIREAVRIGATGPNQAKSFLRCGMGPCQGRMCGPTVTAIIADERQASCEDVGYFRIRPPLKPIPLSSLAGADLGDEPPADRGAH